MQIVVPLAGPDFVLENGSVKAEIPIDGVPLLRRALETRPWWQEVSGSDLIFVLMDLPRTRAFADGPLRSWYPDARTVFLSRPARGAALSALAGLTLTLDAPGPICIDLADILFCSRFNPVETFSDSTIGGAALIFPSDNPAYSYLRTDASGLVTEAAEKRVISENASAGVYFFSSQAVYLAALAHNLANAESVTHRGLFFVCPVFNGVLTQGLSCVVDTVSDIIDLKTG